MRPRMYRIPKNVRRFDFQPGRKIAGKYEIERILGSGWEGEVYAIIERTTGIRRAAKFYYPHRDPTGKAAIAYARKLDALRHCPILMQYHHQEIAYVQKRKVLIVISELVEGQKLSEFLYAQRNHVLSTFAPDERQRLDELLDAAADAAEAWAREGTSKAANRFNTFELRPADTDRLAAPGRGIAAHLTRNRPGVTVDRAGDLAHALVLGLEQRDLLTLSERQVPARRLGQAQRRHPASVAEPARPDRPRHAHRLRSLDRRHPRRDQPPELPLHRTRGLRPAR